jgi:hypothetical protein
MVEVKSEAQTNPFGVLYDAAFVRGFSVPTIDRMSHNMHMIVRLIRFDIIDYNKTTENGEWRIQN